MLYVAAHYSDCPDWPLRHFTPDNAVTIADGSAPTVSELLELCVELKNQIETLKARCEARGLIAT